MTRQHRLPRRVKVGTIATAALCAALSTTAPATSAASQAAQGGQSQGSTITVLDPTSFSGNWTGFDPAATTSGSEFEGAVLGSLFDVGPHNSLVPDLATGYKLSDGGRALTISLRHGATFSNGDPFDSAVLAFNFKRDVDRKLPNGNQNALNWPMSSVSTPNRYTAVVHFTRVFAPVVSELDAGPFGFPVDPVALQKMGEVAYNLTPVGAGPFMVQKDVPSSRLDLVRNPHYWKAGYPKLRGIHVEAVGSDESSYEALLAGQAQIAESIGTLSVVSSARKAGRVNVYRVPPNSPFVVRFNTGAAPFNSTVAREAIYYATDASAVDSRLFASEYPLTQSPTGPAGLFYEQKVPGYRTYDLAKAKALVQQLGGLHVSLDVFALPFVISAAEALQSEWHQAGIISTINQVNLTQYISAFLHDSWSSFLTVAGSYDPALGPLSVNTDFLSTSPFSGVHDPRLDGMLEQAAGTVNQSVRAADYKRIFRYISDHAYEAFLFNFAVFNMSAKNVVGASGPPGVGGVGSVINWADVALR